MPRLLVALLIALVLLLPSAGFAHAQGGSAQKSVITQSLADIGYKDDVTLHGPEATADLSFPLPDSGITGGTLTLKLTLSQILDPQSRIQVMVNNRPILTIFANELASDGTLIVPVPATSEPYLGVRVFGNLIADDGRCLPNSDESLWMVVANTSKLSFDYNLDQASIQEFLRLPGGQVVVRGLWDTPQNQTNSIALFSALKHLYHNTPTRVLLAEDASEQTSNSLQREIVLNGDALAAPLQLDGNTLMVAAGRPAINALMAEAEQPLLLGRALVALDTPVAPETNATAEPANTIAKPASDQRLTLAELGMTDQERSGTGVLPISTRFTLADLGGWPRNLRFNLDSSFDQLPTDTAERAVLRVRLNGTLLESTDIRGVSKLKQTIDLPAELLKSENYLETAFVYARESGNCEGAPYQFTSQLHSTSAFTWDGYGEGQGRLPELIGAFTGEGDLYLPNSTPESARAAAHLVGGLSAFTAAPLLPRFAEPATLAQSSTSAYRIIVGGDSTMAQTLKLPVDINTNVTIVDPQTGTTLVSGQPDQPLVAAHYLSSGTPTLVVQPSSGADDAMLSATIARLIDPDRFFKLNGDVVIGDSMEVVALNLNSKELEVQQTSATSEWQNPLNDYRWLLVVLAAVLIIGLWWQVYNRVGQRPPLPASPADTQRDQAE